MEPVQNEKGEWVIPATRRPDGSWRKEVVMRAGYTPQEEVKAYETTAQKIKKKGIPGMPPKQSITQPPPQKVNKQQNPPTTKQPSKADADNSELKIQDLTISESVAVVVDPTKKIKALKKKLREIEEIEKKNVADLSPEQLEKLDRKSSIEVEISTLESALS